MCFVAETEEPAPEVEETEEEGGGTNSINLVFVESIGCSYLCLFVRLQW